MEQPLTNSSRPATGLAHCPCRGPEGRPVSARTLWNPCCARRPDTASSHWTASCFASRRPTMWRISNRRPAIGLPARTHAWRFFKSAPNPSAWSAIVSSTPWRRFCGRSGKPERLALRRTSRPSAPGDRKIASTPIRRAAVVWAMCSESSARPLTTANHHHQTEERVAALALR